MYFRVFIIQKLLIQRRHHRKTFFQINILTSTPRVRVFERKSQSIVNSSHIYFGRIHIIPVTLLTKEFVHKVFNLFIEIERFSFECRKVIGFAFTTLRDWLKRFAPLFYPIRRKTKTNCVTLACIFPRFASATCNYFEF